MYFRQKQMRSLVRLILEAVRQTGVTAMLGNVTVTNILRAG